VTWEQSEKILTALKRALASADPQTLRFMLVELQRHKIELPEANAKFLQLAKTDSSLRDVAVDLFSSRPNPPAEAIGLFVDAAKNEGDVNRRARALSALCRSANDAAVGVLAHLGESAPAELLRVRAEYVRDAGRFSQADQFAKLATSEDAATREMAYAVLLQIAQNKQAPKESSTAAADAIKLAWTKPAWTDSLLRVIGKEKVDGYAQQIRARLSDPDLKVKEAAEFASSRFGADHSDKARISQLPFEQTVAAVLKSPGDAKLGGELFVKLTCVNCHTVSKNEAPKGPFLGGIAKRYSRPELVESIVKPNAKIAQGFVTHYFVTKKRQRVDGFIVREAGDEVEVRTVQGASVTLKNADIARKGTVATSIMPEQLVDNLSLDELASIVAYLESLKAD
jgi:putative heme-binding domain-containing protein